MTEVVYLRQDESSLIIDAEREGLGALDELIGDEDDVAIAAITVAELVVGSELADAKRQARREAFLGAALEAFSADGEGFTDLPEVALRRTGGGS